GSPPNPHTATPSLHDALPISTTRNPASWRRRAASRKASPVTFGTSRAVDTPAPLCRRGGEAFSAKMNGPAGGGVGPATGNASLRSEEHTSELQSRENLVCRLL